MNNSKLNKETARTKAVKMLPKDPNKKMLKMVIDMKLRLMLSLSALFSCSYLNAYSQEELSYRFGIVTNGVQIQLPAFCFIHTALAGNRQYPRLIVRDSQNQLLYGLDLQVHGMYGQPHYSLEIDGQSFFLPLNMPHSFSPVPYHLLENTVTPGTPVYPTQNYMYMAPQSHFPTPVVQPQSQGQGAQQQRQEERLRLYNTNSELIHKNQELETRNDDLFSCVNGYRQKTEQQQTTITELTKKLNELIAQNKILTKKNNGGQSNHQVSLLQSSHKLAEQTSQTTQTDLFSEPPVTHSHAGSQTEFLNMDVGSQTENLHTNAGSQTEFLNMDVGSQTENLHTNVASQTKIQQHNDVSTQTRISLKHVQSQTKIRRMHDQSTQMTPDEPEYRHQRQEQAPETKEAADEAVLPVQVSSTGHEMPSNAEQCNTQKKKKCSKKKKKKQRDRVDKEPADRQNEVLEAESLLPEKSGPQTPPEKKKKLDVFRKQIIIHRFMIRRYQIRAGRRINNPEERNAISEMINSYCSEFIRDNTSYDEPESTARYLQQELATLIGEMLERNQLVLNQNRPNPLSSSEQTTEEVAPGRALASAMLRGNSSNELLSAHLGLWLDLVSHFPALMYRGTPFFPRLQPVPEPPSPETIELLSTEALTQQQPSDRSTTALMVLMHEHFEEHEPLKKVLLEYTFDFEGNPKAIFAFVWAVLAAHIMNDDELIDHLLNLLPGNYTELLETYIGNLHSATEQNWLIYNLFFIQRFAFIRQRCFLECHTEHGITVDADTLAARHRHIQQLQRLIDPILYSLSELGGASAPTPLSRLQQVRRDTELNTKWLRDCELLSNVFRQYQSLDELHAPQNNEEQNSLLPMLLIELQNAADSVNPQYHNSVMTQLADRLHFNYEIFGHLFQLLSSLEREDNRASSGEGQIQVSANAFLQALLNNVNDPGIQRMLTAINERGINPDDVQLEQLINSRSNIIQNGCEVNEIKNRSIFLFLKALAFYLNRPILWIYPAPPTSIHQFEAHQISTDPNQNDPEIILNGQQLYDRINLESPLILGFERLETNGRYRWFRYIPRNLNPMVPVSHDPQTNTTGGSDHNPNPDGAAPGSASGRPKIFFDFKPQYRQPWSL